MDELRLAFRRLWKRPGATIASVVTLAGSIGAAVVMWTVLHRLIIQPLDVQDPATLASVVIRRGAQIEDGFNYSRYREIRDSAPFAASAAWGTRMMRVTGGGHDRVSTVHFVTHDYFDVLGVSPAPGRELQPADDMPGAPLVAVISDRFWQRAFDRRGDIVGTRITVGRKAGEIVGVAPPSFRGVDLTSAPDVYLALHAIEDVVPAGNYLQSAARSKGFSPNSWISIFGRTTPDADATAVATAIRALPGWQQPARSTSTVELLPINETAFPLTSLAAIERFTRLLTITVGLLLFAGCATVALLLMLRTEQRRVEFATCLALGASKTRLVTGVAIEGASMAAAGGLLALPVATWLFGLLETFSLPGEIALRDFALSVDGRAIAAASVGAFASALLVSLLIAGGAIRGWTMQALRGGAGSLPRARAGVRGALIVGQVAIAVALISGTVLFVRSLSQAIHVNRAHDSGAFVTAYFNLNTLLWDPVRTNAFYADVLRRLQGNGAIAAMSAVSSMGGMSREGRLYIDGVPRALPTSAWFKGLSSDYFAVMNLPLVAGRGFSDKDFVPGPLIGVVSESFARFIAADGNAVGHRVRLPWGGPPGTPPNDVTVIGVVPDLIDDLRRLQPFTLYMPAASHNAMISVPHELVIRASGDADAVKREVLAVSRAVQAPLMPTMRTLREHLYDQMRPQQLGATVLGALGVIAALLTMLGLYVIAESTAAQRTRELAIRAALGATRRNLRELLIRDNLRIATVGALAGLAIVYAGAGTIRTFLFGVEAFDPLTLTAVPSTIVAVAVLVALGPAFRASRSDLARVLRD